MSAKKRLGGRAHGMVAGIDLGGTQVRLAVAGPDGKAQGTTRTRTSTLSGPDGFADWVQQEIARLLKGRPLLQVGIGAPGPVEPQAGILVNPPNLPRGWPQNLALGPLVERRVEVPVHLENDANLAALAEFRRGAGRGATNLVYITWSTGVGAGLVLDGRLYSGSHGTAGEIGHTIVDPNGPLCACGQRGCLEALAGGAALAAQAGLPAVEIFDAAKLGDLAARALVNRAAVACGTALISLTNLIDPDVVVIGGGIGSHAWATVEGTLNRTLRSSPFIKAGRRPKLLRARLGEQVGLVGAVEWALTHLPGRSQS